MPAYTMQEFKDQGELTMLKQLETLVRIMVAFPDSVAETRAKRKIPEILDAIESLYSHPFDVDAACQEFIIGEINNTADTIVELDNIITLAKPQG